MSVRECVFLKRISQFSLAVTQCLLADKWACLYCGCAAELNMSARGCGGSSTSLPGTPGGEPGPANRVLSWAVSFEKLLEDPCGVQHFTVSCARPGGPGAAWHGVSDHLCFSLRRPSCGLKWVRRTFYSGRLVRSSGKSLLAPWIRCGEFGNLLFLCSELSLTVNCLCPVHWPSWFNFFNITSCACRGVLQPIDLIL